MSIDISGWGPKYVPAALKHDMQRRLQDQVLFGSDYPGWSPGQCCDEWEMEDFRAGVIEKLFSPKRHPHPEAGGRHRQADRGEGLP